MPVAIILLSAIIGVGLLLYIHHRMTPSAAEPPTPPAESADECCGRHAVCERDSLLAGTDKAVYYDDEELDRFAGRDAASYTAEEAECFRDVMLTLLPGDVAGWGRSIQQRGITLPADVREEFLLLVSEIRSSHANA